MQRRRDRIVPVAVQAAQRPQRDRMHGRHQDAVHRAQHCLAECGAAIVARNIRHGEDEKGGAQQRIDDAQMQQQNIVGGDLCVCVTGMYIAIYVLQFDSIRADCCVCLCLEIPK